MLVMQPGTERLVELRDGTRLWTTTGGQGPMAVLLHGGPGLWDYLGSLARLLENDLTMVRFDQRGCGRSSGADGPFTLAQAIADLDELRECLGVPRWYVVGHSWGAELALRYAAAYPDRTEAVGYIAGVGAGDTFAEPYRAELVRRLGADLPRWELLRGRERAPEEECEWCLLQWRPDFSPTGDPERHARELWETRPPSTVINAEANAALSAERLSDDLLVHAAAVQTPVTMVLGADDPRPWSATDSLFGSLPHATRNVLDGAGHAPWAECPAEVRDLLLGHV
jgi:proline iminopeptidase